jgi:hypothetical protein
MNAVPFDTLKLARDLETAGLTPPVAAGASAALAEALTGADLATKHDVSLLKSDLTALKHELKHDMAALEARLTGTIELLRRDMIIKLGGMMFVAVGVILTAIRLMPHP